MGKKQIRIFQYDVLLDKEDICDREKEIAALTAAAKTGKRVILLAPRRYGKTSLVKNVVGSAIAHARPKRLVLAADFMGVESLHSIAARLEHGLGQTLAESYSPSILLKRAKDLFRKLSMRIDVDPVTGAPSVGIGLSSGDDRKNILTLLDSIVEFSEQQPLMLIFDEFQDIAFVPEAEAILRSFLQKLSKTSVFILGSKRHLMERMLGNANAPLFQYGDEMHLEPIPFEAWKPYFSERLKPFGTEITPEGLRYLLDRMCQVPNAICELGAWIQERCTGKTLEVADVEMALNDMVEMKQGYVYRLFNMSEREKTLLISLANKGFVLEPQGADFLRELRISKSGVGKMLQKLLDAGIVEQEIDKGWRLSDPVFAHYLSRMYSV
ncbi:MAG: hypothetical protein ABH871_06895 [Pseudomonadota bacterium]